MNQFMNDESILDVAMNAARAGGVTTQKYFADLATAGIENKSVNEKDEGLVTRADIEAEQAIVAEIKFWPKKNTRMIQVARSMQIICGSSIRWMGQIILPTECRTMEFR
jgi:hypothetical protein